MSPAPVTAAPVTRCYAWPLTVGGDDALALHVSTPHQRFAVQLFRCGAEIEDAGVAPGTFEGRDVPLGRPDEGWGWPRYTVPLGPARRDGVYVAVPVAAGEDGPVRSIPADTGVLTRRDACLFVLRREPVRREILVKLPTATYSAYNQLGGVSLYAGAHWVRDWTGQGYVVSLQRPGNGGIGGTVMEGDAPDPYARSSRRQVFAHWDAPFVSWLESTGHDVSYCTDDDLHHDAGLLDDRVLLLSAGHDEYWSATMRRRVLEFVDRGGNLCFFAGDVACFVVDVAADGDRLLCAKMAGGGPDHGSLRPGALWHVDDPEDWLTLASGAWGGGWWDGVRAVEAYRTAVPQHWAFAGVDVDGEGFSGGDATPVIGYETDGAAIERGSDPPRLRESRGGSGGRVLLAMAELSTGWVAGSHRANAAMMIRTARSGGTVFTAGTTDWPLGLDHDPVVRRITANVVGRLAQPTLALHGPTYREGEYLGDGDVVGPDQVVAWYLDGPQQSERDLRTPEWIVAGGRLVGSGDGERVETVADAGPGWLTVTVRARDAVGRTHVGSRTVRVLSAEDHLRRRIVRALHAMANPDEQGGALVDQKASEEELAGRVIPVRLQWVRRHAAVLDTLLSDLEAHWTANGRMDEAGLREDER